MTMTKQGVYTIVAAKKGKPVEVRMYEAFSQYSKMNPANYQELINTLAKDHPEIIVRLHSPGGSVWDGIAMMSTNQATKAKITVIVDGIAASMASAFMCSAEKVCAAKNSRIMVHQASLGAWGSSGQLKRAADLLDSVNDTIAQIYADKTGKTKEWIMENWMKEGEDKWLTAQEALKEGLIDEVLPGRANAPKDVEDNYEKIAAEFYGQLIDNENPDSEMNLKQMAKKLGLPEDATQEQVTAKIEELQALESNQPEQKAQDKLVAAAVALGMRLGIINKDNEKKWADRFEADPEDAVERLEELIEAKGDQEPEEKEEKKEKTFGSKRLTDILDKYDAGKKPEATEKKFSELTEEEIEAMEESDPAKLQALMKAEFPDSDNPKQD